MIAILKKIYLEHEKKAIKPENGMKFPAPKKKQDKKKTLEGNESDEDSPNTMVCPLAYRIYFDGAITILSQKIKWQTFK